uniref:Methyltransferase type 11 domain-containing protein n=1 Tax=Haptolina ericina TaxID=156174 RepID=A0A7S3ADC4_9EUKA
MYKSALFPFEWAGLTFEDLVEYRYTTQEQPAASRGALEHDVPKDAPALLLGTGTSLFPEAMAEAGWGDLTSIDFAASVVGPRREAAEEHLLGVRWLETDARRMDAFASCTFASALDKGLLDGSYLGGPPQLAMEEVASETARVLRPGGLLLTMSFSSPPFFLPPLQVTGSRSHHCARSFTCV